MTATLSASALAEDATYKVGGLGSGTAVRVLRAELVPDSGFSRTRTASKTNTFEVASSYVATPARGDTITIGAEVWRIGEPPVHDPVTASWKMDCHLT